MENRTLLALKGQTDRFGRAPMRHDVEYAERLRHEFITCETFTVNRAGVVRWRSNGAVPPAEVLEVFAYIRDTGTGPTFDLEACERARAADLAAFAAEYRARQAARTPEQIAEQRAEARAAMGPGVEMVDILSGERWTT